MSILKVVSIENLWFVVVQVVNRFRRHLFFLSLLSLLSTPIQSLADSVRLPTQRSEQTKLPDVLIIEALKRGQRYKVEYPYGVDIDHLPLSTRIEGVRSGRLDVFYAMTTAEYEREFQAVYIPIYRGLMGMRLALIKSTNQNLLSNVSDISGLQKFVAGQGKLWADSKILHENGLPLVLEAKYPNLFRMLEADRFDYFPRGIHEPWSEVEDWKHLDLTVDPHILIQYKAPFYFFVNRKNQALANHLSLTLTSMIEDGSFNRLFFNDREVKAALDNANVNARRVIKLENPFLSSDTPLDNPKLWFDPSQGASLTLSEPR